MGAGALTAAMFCFLDWTEQEEGWGCEVAGLSGGTQHCLLTAWCVTTGITTQAEYHQQTNRRTHYMARHAVTV